MANEYFGYPQHRPGAMARAQAMDTLAQYFGVGSPMANAGMANTRLANQQPPNMPNLGLPQNPLAQYFAAPFAGGFQSPLGPNAGQAIQQQGLIPGLYGQAHEAMLQRANAIRDPIADALSDAYKYLF